MTLDQLGFKYDRLKRRPYQCDNCTQNFKKSGATLERHFKFHLEGGVEMFKNKYHVKYWTDKEFDLLLGSLMAGTPFEAIKEQLPNRTYGSINIKISGINRGLEASSQTEFDDQMRRYSVPGYLQGLIKELKSKGQRPFDIEIDYQKMAEDRIKNQTAKVEVSGFADNKPAVKMVNGKGQIKALEIIQAIDETFDYLKDLVGDLVDAAVEEKSAKILEEKNIEIASLRTVVDAAKQSSLVSRLQSRLRGGN